MIIGAARSGSTTLYEYLRRHPRLFLCSPKEPCYFAYEDVYARGDDWYHALFADAPTEALCGEASTTYSRWPHTLDSPALVTQRMPNIRVIYIVRHPIDRAYSMYAFRVQMQMIEPVTFEQAIEQTDLFIDTSLYKQQIDRWLRFIPREQLLVLSFDDLKNQPAVILDEVQQFLGIERHDLVGEGDIRANWAGKQSAVQQIDERVSTLKRIPGIQQAAHLVPKAMRDRMYRAIVESRLGRRYAREAVKPASMLPETRQRLLDRFAQPNRELEQFLDRQFPRWYR
jgi:hypothetical protein